MKLNFVEQILHNFQKQEQLERAQDLQDSSIEAEAFGNLGIAKLNRYYTIKYSE